MLVSCYMTFHSRLSLAGLERFDLICPLLPIGPENHQFVLPVPEESSLESVGSVYEKKPVVGDQTAGPVLECLIYVAHLYGEPVLTYQYLPYIGYLVRCNHISSDTLMDFV